MTMMTRRVIVSTLSFVLTASPAAAQTVATSSPAPQPVLTTTTTTGTTGTTGTTTGGTTTGTTTGGTTTGTGAYESLSIGNRKIARALFEAQKTETPTSGTGTTGTTTGTGTGTTPTTSKTLTLDQIAGLKQSGQGWGQVFRAMQARGLVTEKNLGQVVSQYSRTHQASRADTTTANNRVDDFDSWPAGADGGGKHDRSSVGQGNGHSKQAGSTVSGNGSTSRGGGNAGSNSGGNGGGNGLGKSK